MNTCPCCSEPLLRHARHGEIYWYCPHCHQEMPNLNAALNYSVPAVDLVPVASRLMAHALKAG
jgi:ribosomal protein L37AE/L43A